MAGVKASWPSIGGPRGSDNSPAVTHPFAGPLTPAYCSTENRRFPRRSPPLADVTVSGEHTTMSDQTAGQPITKQADRLQVPDHPIIPFIEGDGTGPDI